LSRLGAAASADEAARGWMREVVAAVTASHGMEMDYQMSVLDASLRNWFDSLPDWIRASPSEASPSVAPTNAYDGNLGDSGISPRLSSSAQERTNYMVAYLHIFYHTSLILLHRPKMMAELRDRPKQLLSSHSFHVCHTAATEVSRILAAILPHNPDLDYMTAYVAFLVFQSGLVHVMASQVGGGAGGAATMQEEADRCAALHLEGLSGVARRWFMAGRLQAVLANLIRTAAMARASGVVGISDAVRGEADQGLARGDLEDEEEYEEEEHQDSGEVGDGTRSSEARVAQRNLAVPKRSKKGLARGNPENPAKNSAPASSSSTPTPPPLSSSSSSTPSTTISAAAANPVVTPLDVSNLSLSADRNPPVDILSSIASAQTVVKLALSSSGQTMDAVNAHLGLSAAPPSSSAHVTLQEPLTRMPPAHAIVVGDNASSENLVVPGAQQGDAGIGFLDDHGLLGGVEDFVALAGHASMGAGSASTLPPSRVPSHGWDPTHPPHPNAYHSNLFAVQSTPSPPTSTPSPASAYYQAPAPQQPSSLTTPPSSLMPTPAPPVHHHAFNPDTTGILPLRPQPPTMQGVTAPIERFLMGFGGGMTAGDNVTSSAYAFVLATPSQQHQHIPTIVPSSNASVHPMQGMALSDEQQPFLDLLLGSSGLPPPTG
ncbi:hypothetical protein HDU96_001886, partial [Phlyctochytrium bullatum]